MEHVKEAFPAFLSLSIIIKGAPEQGGVCIAPTGYIPRYRQRGRRKMEAPGTGVLGEFLLPGWDSWGALGSSLRHGASGLVGTLRPDRITTGASNWNIRTIAGDHISSTPLRETSKCNSCYIHHADVSDIPIFLMFHTGHHHPQNPLPIHTTLAIPEPRTPPPEDPLPPRIPPHKPIPVKILHLARLRAPQGNKARRAPRCPRVATTPTAP